MSAINRIKKRKVAQEAVQPGPTEEPVDTPVHTPQTKGKKKIFTSDQPNPQKQKQYQQYYQLAQSNPLGCTFSNSLFPNSSNLYRQYRYPLSIMTSPILALENEDCPMLSSNIQKIPRCGSCRSYMNCYNELKKKTFVCFICGRENNLDAYNYPEGDKLQLTSSIYQAPGSPKYYNTTPPENALIFLIDVSPAASECKMLYYAAAAIKQILASPDYDDYVIYFYTYDEVLHQYDFSGEETKCVIMDPTIVKNAQSPEQNFLESIREKLFSLLEDLEEISESNSKRGSNFYGSFQSVFESVKHTGGKMFIFQSNEGISGQLFTQQQQKQKNQQLQQPKNLYQTKNKMFFDAFVSQMLQNTISFSLFVFQRTFKNMRVFSDICKLTNSELKVYWKDEPEDLNKFYYDLSYLLGATYCSDVKMELTLSPGWNFTAVYGNLYRVKEYITFKFCHLEPSRKVYICVTPQQNQNIAVLPYFALQIITNYFYKRQHYISVATIVHPLTGYLERLFQGIEYQVASAVCYRTHLSSLRLDAPAVSRKKFHDYAAEIWKCALAFYKRKENIPQECTNFMLGQMAILKSYHNQFELINNTLFMDKVVAQRNQLQSAGSSEIYTFWNPYLFNIGNMDETMCRDDGEFVYPEMLEAKFPNVKDGLFVLDCGLALYLYIGKSCPPEHLKELFGKQKISRNEHLTEDNFTDTFFAGQVQTLIRTLREQKSFGWIPLYIVRCGDGSQNQKNFYMNFYPQKYDEFRNYRMNLQEFLSMLEQNQQF